MTRFIIAITAIVFATAIDVSAQAPAKHQLDRIEENQLELLRKADEQIKLQKQTIAELRSFREDYREGQAATMKELKKINGKLDDIDTTLAKVLSISIDNQKQIATIVTDLGTITVNLSKIAKQIQSLEADLDAAKRQVQILASRPPETRTVYVREPVYYYVPYERTYYVNVGYGYLTYSSGYWGYYGFGARYWS